MIFMLRATIVGAGSPAPQPPILNARFQSAAQQALPEFPVPFPHGRVHAVPFQMQFQKAADNSGFLPSCKTYPHPSRKQGIL